MLTLAETHQKLQRLQLPLLPVQLQDLGRLKYECLSVIQCLWLQVVVYNILLELEENLHLSIIQLQGKYLQGNKVITEKLYNGELKNN